MNDTIGLNWWQRLDRTAKMFLLILTISSMVAGLLSGRAAVIAANAAATEREKIVREEDRKRVAAVELEIARVKLDVATTRAAAEISKNDFQLQLQGQVQANKETAEKNTTTASQLGRLTAQVAKQQELVALYAKLADRVTVLENGRSEAIEKLTQELHAFTKEATKTRKSKER